ncbi:MAG: type IV secretory system conjugative DNA transfer family protein [Clostridia bacterium]|nr:type IV secretory system conjugative DNA transfer family protein [Clostridia bacterium]
MNIFTNKSLLRGYESKELKKYYDPIETLPKMVAYEDLGSLKLNGILLSSQYIEGKLMQIYSDYNSHALIISATGGGKTTSCVIPTVISYARQLEKKSMVISDPKGEIYTKTAKTLEDEGYSVYLLNYRDPEHSEFWNPLTPIYREYHKVFKLYDEVEAVETERGLRNKFRGKIYDDQEMLDNDFSVVFDTAMAKVGNMIDDLAGMMITFDNPKDRSWDSGAMDLLKAFLWAMLEDSREKPNGDPPTITEDTFSLRTMFRIFSSFKPMEDRNVDNGYFEDRPTTSNAFILSRTAMDCSKVTRSSYTSVFQTKLTVFRNSTVQTITSCNSFDFSELLNGKVAVFICYQDEIKTHYQLISLFVQNAYKFLIEEANKTERGKLDIPFYFILDEFGNFPPITDFDTAITAARGRNIFFFCILQSYSQLDNIYGKNTAEIIRDNLNIKIFLGSNNPDTLERFQKECGEFTRLSPKSVLNGKEAELSSFALETIPLVTKTQLSSFNPGECVIIELNKPYAFWSKLERSYMCKEFNSLPLKDEHEYQSKINPYDTKYVYRIPKRKDEDDDDDDLF